MEPHRSKAPLLAIAALLTLTTTACTRATQPTSEATAQATAESTAQATAESTAQATAESTAGQTASPLANGKAIYVTGRDAAGKQIAAKPPALFPKCAACHFQDGHGGLKLPDGAVTADLRHHALVTAQKHPYTRALLERAIARGIDNENKPLDPAMPRWQLTPTDLHDVATYVLTQLK